MLGPPITAVVPGPNCASVEKRENMAAVVAWSPSDSAPVKALMEFVALAPVPIATAPPNNPHPAFAVAPSPIPIAMEVMLLVQPLPLPIPKAEKHVALAVGAPLNAPVAVAPESNAASTTPPALARTLSVPLTARRC